MAEGGLLEKEFRDLYQNEGGYKVGHHALQKKCMCVVQITRLRSLFDSLERSIHIRSRYIWGLSRQATNEALLILPITPGGSGRGFIG